MRRASLGPVTRVLCSLHLASPALLALLLGGCGEHVFDHRSLSEIEDTWVDPGEPDSWGEVASTDGEGDGGRTPFGCKLANGFADGDRTRLAYAAVAELARGAGIECGYNLVKAVALAGAESGRFQYVYLRNKNCSLDRGIWQINSTYWKAHSSYDLEVNAEGMVEISSNGTKWTPWVAYTNGRWTQFRASACHAVAELCNQSYCD